MSTMPVAQEGYAREFMEHHGIFLVSDTPEGVLVAHAGTASEDLRHLLKLYHGKPVEFQIVDAKRVTEHLAGCSVRTGLQEANDTGGAELPALDHLVHDAPVINLVNSIFLEGIRRGASDIHIEAGQDETLVRFRMLGTLTEGRRLDKDAIRGLAARIKYMADLNFMECRLPQDGCLRARIGNEALEMRVSCIPVKDGESIVLRLFNRFLVSGGLEELGLAPGVCEVLRDICSSGPGLFLMAGPTGSGKSTTLHAMIDELAGSRCKIITVEDPVEIIHPGILQVQVNEAVGLHTAMILPRILRQDPDVVMVGEIRDSETAELATRAALTGHLVLASVHASDALGAIARMRDLGIAPWLLAAVLSGIAGQHLAPIPCSHCTTDVHAHGDDASTVPMTIGCVRCNFTGLAGRTACAEAFIVDSRARELLASDVSISRLSEYLRSQSRLSSVGAQA